MRRVNSEREAEVSRRLEMAKSDPLRHDPLGHGVTRYEAEAQAETQLAHADIESGMRAAVRMYVSTIEIRGNLLVSDGFDNHVVVLRMGENQLPLSEDEAGDDDDDDDDDSREDEGDDGEEGSGVVPRLVCSKWPQNVRFSITRDEGSRRRRALGV